MKNNFFKLVLILIPYLISSCTPQADKRRNYFYPGVWVGENTENINQRLCLEVSEIDERTYRLSQGINTVEDVVINRFFSLTLTLIDDEKGSFLIDLINMDVERNTKSAPVTYLDDNLVYIMPYHRVRQSPLCGYNISTTHYCKLDYVFNSLLYLSEE